MTKIHNIYLADKETMCFIRISKYFRVSKITKQVNGTMQVTGKQQLTKKGFKVIIDLSVVFFSKRRDSRFSSFKNDNFHYYTDRRSEKLRFR